MPDTALSYRQAVCITYLWLSSGTSLVGQQYLKEGLDTMGKKAEKERQRQAYKAAFKGVKHNHGTRSIKKKDESALGR